MKSQPPRQKENSSMKSHRQVDRRQNQTYTKAWFLKVSKAVKKTLSPFQTRNSLIKIPHPKRFRTSWNYYVKEKFRPLFRRYGSFSTVLKTLGIQWSKLSDNQKEKYIRMYFQDRIRFDNEMANFRAKYFWKITMKYFNKPDQILIFS